MHDLVELEDRTDDEGGSLLEEVLFGEGDLPEIPARPTPWGGDGMRPRAEELAHMRTWDSFSKQGLLSLHPTHRVQDQQRLQLGRREWTVVHTPGHSPACVCLAVDGVLFTGDTLFAGSVGRTDLPGGDTATLNRSLRRLIEEFPEETVIHPGHSRSSTIGEERRSNPFLRGIQPS